MVHVSKGVLLRCSDPAIKEFIKYVDDKELLGRRFIIHDLDDIHLFISADVPQQLQSQLDDLMEKNSYSEFDQSNSSRVRKE